jgi:regulator of protease activity HflC (stomatin/prohibitin superfamily)
MDKETLGGLAILVGVLLLIGLVTAPIFLTTVKTYEEGVVITLGKIKDRTTGDGLALRIPFIRKIDKVDMRERVKKVSTETVSKEGLKFGVEITVRYQVRPGQAVELVKGLQTPLNELIETYANSTIDDVATGKDKNEMYSDVGRVEIVTAVKEKLNEELGDYAQINQVVFENIQLPATITNAIEAQQAELEKIKKAENQKQVAEKQAEIRRIEAQGIADANNIIQRSLTTQYLQYEAIQKFNPDAEKVYIPQTSLVPVINY